MDKEEWEKEMECIAPMLEEKVKVIKLSDSITVDADEIFSDEELESNYFYPCFSLFFYATLHFYGIMSPV